MQEPSARTSSRLGGTFALSFTLCALGVIATGLALLAGFSATLLADFLRRTSDSIATGVAWIFHRRRLEVSPDAPGAEPGNLVAWTVAIAFCVSGLAIAGSSIALALRGYGARAPIQAILPGLFFAAMGSAVNLRFFFKFRSMDTTDPQPAGVPLAQTQRRLYAMKTLIDGSVLLSLSLRLAPLPDRLLAGLDLGTALVLGGFLLLRGICALAACLSVSQTL